MKKDTGVKSARRRQSKNLIALPFSLFCCVWLPSAASAQTYTVLHDFALSDGAGPPAGLVLSGDALYGVAWVGAVAGRGSVYKMCTDGSGYALLKEFTIAEGGLPESGLAAAAPALADCPGAVNHQPS